MHIPYHAIGHRSVIHIYLLLNVCRCSFDLTDNLVKSILCLSKLPAGGRQFLCPDVCVCRSPCVATDNFFVSTLASVALPMSRQTFRHFLPDVCRNPLPATDKFQVFSLHLSFSSRVDRQIYIFRIFPSKETKADFCPRSDDSEGRNPLKFRCYFSPRG